MKKITPYKKLSNELDNILKRVALVLKPYIDDSGYATIELLKELYLHKVPFHPKNINDYISRNPQLKDYKSKINIGEKAIIDLFTFLKYIRLMKLKKKKEIKQVKQEEKESIRVSAPKMRYSYPEFEGKPLDKDLKKKYRVFMRKYIKHQMSESEASKMALKDLKKLASVDKSDKPSKKNSEKDKTPEKKVKKIKEKPEEKVSSEKKPKKVIKKPKREED